MFVFVISYIFIYSWAHKSLDTYLQVAERKVNCRCRQTRLCVNLLQGRAVNETKWLPLLSHWRQFGRGFLGNANLVSHWARGEMVLLYTRIDSLDFVFSSVLPSVSAAVIIVTQSGLCSPRERKLSDKKNKSEMFSAFTRKLWEGHRLYSKHFFLWALKTSFLCILCPFLAKRVNLIWC